MAAPPISPSSNQGPTSPVELVNLNGVILNPTDKIGNFNESVNDNSTNLFTDYEITNEYEYDKHIYGAGITAPEGFSNKKLALFQLATPTLLWICNWTACKFGQCPEYPSTDVNDSNWVLVDIIPQTAQLGLSPDGVTPLYRLSGTYVYMHLNPSDDVYKQVAFSRPAWIDNTFTRTIPSNKKTSNLIDTQQQAGGVLTNPVIR